MRGGHDERSGRISVRTSALPRASGVRPGRRPPPVTAGGEKRGGGAESPDRPAVGNSAGHLPGAQHRGMRAGYEAGNSPWGPGPAEIPAETARGGNRVPPGGLAARRRPDSHTTWQSMTVNSVLSGRDSRSATYRASHRSAASSATPSLDRHGPTRSPSTTIAVGFRQGLIKVSRSATRESAPQICQVLLGFESYRFGDR